MTAIGSRRHDARGRSTGRIKGRNKHNRIVGQFVPRRRELYLSPAWQAITPHHKTIVERLEVEHMAHGGFDNGALPCTYDDFVEWGARRKSIAGLLRDLRSLGIVRLVRKGCRGCGEIPGTASLYELTYLATKYLRPADTWKKFKDSEQAFAALNKARCAHQAKLKKARQEKHERNDQRDADAA